VNLLPKLGMRNNTKHPVIDRRGNVLYITVGISDRYWREVEEGRGAIVCTERDVAHLLNDRDEPKGLREQAELEKFIDPHRAEIAARKKHAREVYDPPMLKSAIATHRASKEAVAAASAIAAMGVARGESAEVAALREANAALMARLERLEAKAEAPTKAVK